MKSLLPFIKRHLALIVIFGLAVLIRWLVVTDNSIFFYYDQARDASISRTILEQGDIKLQGPSVSGTADSVYHGVLYYYVIGPLYTASQGDPRVVALALAVFGSLSVFVMYALGQTAFRSRPVGLVAALFTAVSALSVHQHVWLSNPQLGSVFLPATYLSIWRIFYAPQDERSQRWWEFAALGLLLAACLQSALQSVVVLGSVAIAWLWLVIRERSVLVVSLPKLFLLGTSFVLGISSMLLTELLLWKNGILSLSSLHLSDHAVTGLAVLEQIFALYFELLGEMIAPGRSWIAWIVLPIVILLFATQPRRHQVWLASWLLAPLWLLVWHFRDPKHTFIGLELAIFLLAAWGLVSLARKGWMGRVSVMFAAAVFFVLQATSLSAWQERRSQYYGIQQGALLTEQLALIDQTYRSAAGEQFTISTLTSPYAINTTWSYLYSWHGQRTAGYRPHFFGMSQLGYPGGELLPEQNEPAQLHFTIIEPDTTLSPEQIQEFIELQVEFAGPVTQRWEFGSLRLQEHRREKTEAIGR